MPATHRLSRLHAAALVAAAGWIVMAPGRLWAQPVPNSPNLQLTTTHTGTFVTDYRSGRTFTGGSPTYTYDTQDFYYDVDVVNGSGRADRVERWVEDNLTTSPSDAHYADQSNTARKVTVVKGPAWNQPGAVPAVDLIVLLPGTGQDSARALDWFFAQWGISASSHAFPIGRSSALADASRDLGIPQTDVVVAAMNSGRSVENDGIVQWSVFQTTTKTVGNGPNRRHVEVLSDVDYGERMEDVKRVVSFARDMKTDNPRIRNTYLFGFSAGGMIVHDVACLFPDAFDGYGISDIGMNSSLFEHCGAHHRGDGTVLTEQLRKQVGRFPTTLAGRPRPIFFTAGTHSPKASADMGNVTGGTVPATPHCGGGLPLPAFLLKLIQDSEECQEDWALQPELVVKSDDPGTTARNRTVLVKGQFDYQTTVEKYMDLLGLAGARYRSIRSTFPCVGANATDCTTFPMQAQFCSGSGGQTFFKDAASGAHDSMKSAEWIWDRGNGYALGYIEAYGGAHAVPGRGLDCTGGGHTHDVDTGAEFLEFMVNYGGLQLR